MLGEIENDVLGRGRLTHALVILTRFLHYRVTGIGTVAGYNCRRVGKKKKKKKTESTRHKMGGRKPKSTLRVAIAQSLAQRKVGGFPCTR